MSTGWRKSGLQIGEEVILPDELFITGDKAKQRILWCRFIGETATGMIFRIQFQPGWGTEDPLTSWQVEKFVDFASVYCGQVKIYRSDRTQLHIVRKEGMPV